MLPLVTPLIRVHTHTAKRNLFVNCTSTKLIFSDRGCSLTHTIASVNDWQDPVFPEQQAQIIYKQFLLGRNKLRDELAKNVKEHSEDLAGVDIDDEFLTKLCDVDNEPFAQVRMNSDSGCDTDIDDEKQFVFDLRLDENSRTIINILSVVNVLERKHLEAHSTDDDDDGGTASHETSTVESEDDVFSSPATTPSAFSEIDENELESTDTSSQ